MRLIVIMLLLRLFDYLISFAFVHLDL